MPEDEDILTPNERLWVSRFEALKERGYILRPRYRPDWKPSWQVDPSLREDWDCEDGLILNHGYMMDARRLADGAIVFMKVVPKDGKEARIERFLNSEELKHESRKYVAPLLDEFDDPAVPNQVLLVHPYLRHADEPLPGSVREAMDFIQQTLETLIFLHAHGVTHGDLTFSNFMMDARALYPEGWHPQSTHNQPDGLTPLRGTRSRTAVGGVRYYAIDFGLGNLWPDGLDEGRVKNDVAIVGSSFFEFLIENFEDMTWLRPLIEPMSEKELEDRPTAAEAMAIFKTIRATRDTGFFSPRLRLKTDNEGPVTRILKDLAYRAQELKWAITPKPKLPPLF